MEFQPRDHIKYCIQRKEHFINKQSLTTRHYKNMTAFRQYDILKFTILLPGQSRRGRVGTCLRLQTAIEG